MKTDRENDKDIDAKGNWPLKKLFIYLRTRISHSREILKSVAALMSSNVATAILTAISGLLVARFLGPEVTGAFRAFTIPLTYLIFLHLGTWDGLWRQIPYYVGKERPEQVEEIASAAGAFNIFISIIVSIGFTCLSVYSLINQDLVGMFGWLSQLFATWYVFYGGYLTSTYRTLHHFVALARIQVIQAILSLGMVFLLPILGFYGLCARVALPALLTVSLYHRSRPLKIDYRFNKKTLLDLIKIGLPFSFWGNIYTSIWFATESAMVLYLGGISSLGLFSVAVVMRSAANAVPVAIWQVLTPRVVTSLAKNGSVREANKRVVWVTIGLTICMMVLAYFGSFLLEIFVPYFIPKYIDGIQIMQVCLWFAVIEATFLPINILFATGRPWLYGRSVIAGIIVFPIATYLLIPVTGGVLAVAVGSLLGRAARTLAAYVDLAILTRQEIAP